LEPPATNAARNGGPAGQPAPAAPLSPVRKVRYEDFTLADLTGIRNLLRGGSVIDWHKLYFRDRDEVDRFLRVNEMDPRNEDDMRRLHGLRERKLSDFSAADGSIDFGQQILRALKIDFVDRCGDSSAPLPVDACKGLRRHLRERESTALGSSSSRNFRHGWCWRLTSSCLHQDGLEPLGKVDLLLCLAGELAPACADERYRSGSVTIAARHLLNFAKSFTSSTATQL